MAQQTSVEWLMSFIEPSLTEQHRHFFSMVVDQAKEMERRQKEDCWDVAHQAGRFEGKRIAEENWQTFEQYYSETYGKKYQRENKKTPPPPPPPPPPNRLLKEGKEPPKPKPKTK